MLTIGQRGLKGTVGLKLRLDRHPTPIFATNPPRKALLQQRQQHHKVSIVLASSSTPYSNGTTTANGSPSPSSTPPPQPQSTPSPLRLLRHRHPLDDTYVVSLVFQQKKNLLLGSLCLLFCVASNLASPVISGMLFEALIAQAPFETYRRLLTYMLILYVIEPILSKVYIHQICEVGEKVQAALRLEAFRVLLMQRIEFFDRHRVSEVSTLLNKDLEAVRTFCFNNVSRDRGLRALAEATGSVLVLFWLSWRLGPVLAGVIMATAGIAWLYRRQSRKLEQNSAQAQAKMAACIDETVSQVRTVRMYAGESLERERFRGIVMSAYDAGTGFAGAKALLECLNRGAIHFSLLALYGLGGYLVNTGLIPLRILLSAIGFTFSLTFATQGLLQSWTDARTAVAALRRVQAMLSELSVDPSMAASLPPGAWWDMANQMEGTCDLFSDEEEDEGTGREGGGMLTAVEAAARGDFIVKDLAFSYPARPGVQVIKGLSLTLPRGQVTALVGRSGAGKSTIASLIERLYEPDNGEITLGGIPIGSFSRREWVDCVTGLTQEPVLFNCGIYDNISYGRPHATRDQVEAAARAANAHDFIMALPQGYDTVVGERGGLLSGGQRQRVALARALLKDAPILILDEATSHLDTESENAVQQAMDKLVQGRTVLIIAHRLSTVKSADQILVMEDGQVVERGTHAQLVDVPQGRYRSLVSSQALTLSAT